jgi:hypothetical protein
MNMNPQQVAQLAKSDPCSEANLRKLLKMHRGAAPRMRSVIIDVLPVFTTGKQEIGKFLLRELTFQLFKGNRRRTMHGKIIKSLARSGALNEAAEHALFICATNPKCCIRRPAKQALYIMGKLGGSRIPPWPERRDIPK